MEPKVIWETLHLVFSLPEKTEPNVTHEVFGQSLNTQRTFGNNADLGKKSEKYHYREVNFNNPTTDEYITDCLYRLENESVPKATVHAAFSDMASSYNIMYDVPPHDVTSSMWTCFSYFKLTVLKQDLTPRRYCYRLRDSITIIAFHVLDDRYIPMCLRNVPHCPKEAVGIIPGRNSNILPSPMHHWTMESRYLHVDTLTAKNMQNMSWFEGIASYPGEFLRSGRFHMTGGLAAFHVQKENIDSLREILGFDDLRIHPIVCEYCKRNLVTREFPDGGTDCINCG